MWSGKHMTKQLDCTTSITRTQNNAIHGTDCRPHATFSRLSLLASKKNNGPITIPDVDLSTAKLNVSKQQMACEKYALNSISCSAMIFGLNTTHISSERYTTGMLSNAFSSFLHISHLRHTSMWNQCALLAPWVVESTA